MIDPNASAPSAAAFVRRGCEACGALPGAGAALPMVEVPVPEAAAAALGLDPRPAPVLRVLCSACLAQGLGSRPVSLAELVDLAPPAVKQAIHERLIREFEI